jgi:lipid-binding SYLF domain-containing protein
VKAACCAVIFLAALLGMPPLPSGADELSELQELVDEARLTFERFVRHPDLDWLRSHLKEAKGLLILPAVTRAGYVLGAVHASGLFLVRDEESNRWSEPAFYRAVGGSVGFQIGMARSEALVLVMTDRGKQSLLSSTLVFGPGLTVAIGPLGGSISGGVSSSLAVDFVTYASSKGAMASLTLGGTVVAVRDEAHALYYGKSVTPPDILVAGAAHNWYSARLRKTLTRATGGQWDDR